MTLATGRPHPATRLRNEADAAWSAYASTCRTAGTTEQRQWAFGRALAAEERAAQAERTTASR